MNDFSQSHEAHMQNKRTDDITQNVPLSKLARRKAMVLAAESMNIEESPESAQSERDESERSRNRRRPSDHSIERLHSSPTASYLTRRQDDEKRRKFAMEKKEGVISSTSWQSNMYGDKKHSSRRFSSLPDGRGDSLSASGNSVSSADVRRSSSRGRIVSESRGSSKTTPLSRSTSSRSRNGGGQGKYGSSNKINDVMELGNDSLYDSDGESVSSSEADDDINDNSIGNNNSDSEAEGKGGVSLSAEALAQSQQSQSSRSEHKKQSRSIAEKVQPVHIKKTKTYEQKNNSLEDNAGRGRMVTKNTPLPSNKKAADSAVLKKVKRSADKQKSSPVNDRRAKKSVSPGSQHRDASVGFFDLYARHLNASKVSEAKKSESPEGSNLSRRGQVSSSREVSRPDGSPSHSQSRGFGSVRNMSPAQREELGMHVPPSFNSTLANSDNKKVANVLHRLKTPDDLRSKRPHSTNGPSISPNDYSSPSTGQDGSGHGVPSTPTDTAEWARFRSWLEKIGMDKYAVRFRQAGVNKLSVAELLRPQDLNTMRVHPQHIPIIMESIREISRRTLSYAESVASPKSSSPTSSSQFSSPRGHPESTPTAGKPIPQHSSDILSSLSKRLQHRQGVNGLPDSDKSTRSPGINALASVNVFVRAFDSGNDAIFMSHWMKLQSLIGNTRDAAKTTLSVEYHKLDYYCRLFFAIRPILTNSTADKVKAAMSRFKQYLEGFVSVANRTPAQQVLVNSRLFAAYAGIVMVNDPTSNPAYTTIFEPKWRQGLRDNLISFLKSLPSFPPRPESVDDRSHKSSSTSASQRPRLYSAEKEIKQALAALEDSQTTLIASEKLNNHLRPDSNSSPTSTAKAKAQYRATIPLDFSTPHVNASSTTIASEISSDSKKIVLKPRNVTASSSKSIEKSTRTGYLQKQVKKGWKTRFFSLESRVLTYYLNESMTNKKGELILTAKCSFQRLPFNEEWGLDKQYCFQLTDSAFDRTMVLCAGDNDSLMAWESRIKAVILLIEAQSTIAAAPSIDSTIEIVDLDISQQETENTVLPVSPETHQDSSDVNISTDIDPRFDDRTCAVNEGEENVFFVDKTDVSESLTSVAGVASTTETKVAHDDTAQDSINVFVESDVKESVFDSDNEPNCDSCVVDGANVNHPSVYNDIAPDGDGSNCRGKDDCSADMNNEIQTANENSIEESEVNNSNNDDPMTEVIHATDTIALSDGGEKLTTATTMRETSDHTELSPGQFSNVDDFETEGTQNFSADHSSDVVGDSIVDDIPDDDKDEKEEKDESVSSEHTTVPDLPSSTTKNKKKKKKRK